MKKKEWIPYGIAIIILMIGAVYDYQVTDALYGKLPLFGMIFERFLLLPMQSIVVVTLCMVQVRSSSWWALPAAWLVSVYMIQDFIHYWVSMDMMWLGISLVLAIVYTLVVYAVIRRLPRAGIERHIHFFIFYTMVFLSAVLLTTLIKSLWGRIRYRDLQNVQEFCVWYQPCGLWGNKSFPSGHTTAFTAILCLLQWKQNPYEKPSILRYSIITVLVIAMPLSRMVMGAHFLSDTAAGFMITYSCYLIYRQYYRKRGYL